MYQHNQCKFCPSFWCAVNETLVIRNQLMLQRLLLRVSPMGITNFVQAFAQYLQMCKIFVFSRKVELLSWSKESPSVTHILSKLLLSIKMLKICVFWWESWVSYHEFQSINENNWSFTLALISICNQQYASLLLRNQEMLQKIGSPYSSTSGDTNLLNNSIRINSYLQ